MDILATRLAGNANVKVKSKKNLKRLTNESKKVAKIDSKFKSSKKDEKNKNEISSKKKKLIQDALAEPKKSKLENSSKRIITNILKKKKQKVLEDLKKPANKKSSVKKSVELDKPLTDSSNKKNKSKVPTISQKVVDTTEIKSIKSKKRKQVDVVEKSENNSSILKKKEVINYLKALQKVVENNEKTKNSLFDTDKPPIFLQVTCIKVPTVPLHQMRIHLPHSMVSSNDDVALFVKDLKKGRRVDYENTVHHFEDLLQQHNCTQIKTIIPFNQVKTEYKQFEMRRRLLGSYDYFLVDGRIAGHMAHTLGKMFREKRKLPTPVHMDKKNLKSEIDNALKKTPLEIHATGDTSLVQIGTFNMSLENIADNILAAAEELKKHFPGGWNNIRSLRIKTPLSLAIPIYITLKNKNDVEVPVQTPKRPKAYKEVEGELSTFTSNVKVIVGPDGTVSVQRDGPESEDESET